MNSMYGLSESGAPRSSIKILVLGGNGFVGSHVCQEALAEGFSVASLSRSGRPSIHESWADEVQWYKGNLLEPESLKHAMSEATVVVSCVGGFGSRTHMLTLNGTANINAVQVAAENGVKRFVYISGLSFGVLDYCIRGYHEGQKATEAELTKRFPDGAVILRPGYIYGTRPIGPLKIRFGLMWKPFELAYQNARPLRKIPLIGPFFTPTVHVAKVAKVVVRSATDPGFFSSGMIDVYNIIRLAKQK
ncbi:uncharacterized protein At1g32220, chloroplastic-like [Zingiber officinale]|uniref:uncharacterized protein At1g32220, chloroplastic-like n=1 Tax=Zingiber officinale TaxID=94328 RepID=UPI001C4DC2A9|nr:uncharacterized protein At1g32220, chloroplastic-like [Zingiber officinale]